MHVYIYGFIYTLKKSTLWYILDTITHHCQTGSTFTRSRKSTGSSHYFILVSFELHLEPVKFNIILYLYYKHTRIISNTAWTRSMDGTSGEKRPSRILRGAKCSVIFGHYPNWLIRVTRSGEKQDATAYLAPKSFAFTSPRLRTSWLIKFEQLRRLHHRYRTQIDRRNLQFSARDDADRRCVNSRNTRFTRLTRTSGRVPVVTKFYEKVGNFSSLAS